MTKHNLYIINLNCLLSNAIYKKTRANRQGNNKERAEHSLDHIEKQ